MPTYRIDMAYDGTGFRGFASNPGVRTVQGVLEEVLRRVLGREVQTSVAGRTDAGVHARHQVVSFRSERLADIERVERSLRSLLGPEIAVAALAEAPEGFDARFSAVSRSYRYFVDEAAVGDPLRRHRVWHLGEALDVGSMNRVAGFFVGEHDFASLCRAQAGRSTMRRVTAAHWAREGDLLVYDVAAGAFCHQMIRSMVALCVAAGRERLDPEDVPGILAARDRNAARGAAPAHGLILWEVGY